MKIHRDVLKVAGLAILFFALLLFMAGCSSTNVKKSPVGSYSFGSTTFTLDKQGSFRLEHTASADDKQHYIISGVYSYTLESTDEENEISFGKIDITANGLTLDGTAVSSLDFTRIHSGIDISSGEKMLGWWKFMNLVPSGGKMLIGVNLPSKGLRPEDVNTGRDCLFVGDPD